MAQSQASFEEPLAHESWLNAGIKDGRRDTWQVTGELEPAQTVREADIASSLINKELGTHTLIAF